MSTLKNKEKIVSVSSQRQITIPKEFYERLDIGSSVKVTMEENSIVISPFSFNQDDFSDEILKDLIHEGYSGYELLEKFRDKKNRLKKAVDSLKKEGLEQPDITIEELFEDD